MKSITIVGAGMSGLIAAEVLSANGFEYSISERRKISDILTEPENVYYYHSDNISKIIPVPLKKVEVKKYFYDWGELKFISNINPSILFEYTSSDHGLMTNSSIQKCGSSEVGYVEKYDLNLHHILLERHQHKINFGDQIDSDIFKKNENIIINTAPLYILDELIKNKDLEFKDMIDTVYVCEVQGLSLDNIIVIYSNNGFKRLVATGNKIIIENPFHNDIKMVISNLFGSHIQFDVKNESIIRKIDRIDEVRRKNVLFQLTKDYGIYNLGRYATWSYKRVDHIVEDAFDVVNMIRFSQQGRW